MKLIDRLTYNYYRFPYPIREDDLSLIRLLDKILLILRPDLSKLNNIIIVGYSKYDNVFKILYSSELMEYSKIIPEQILNSEDPETATKIYVAIKDFVNALKKHERNKEEYHKSAELLNIKMNILHDLYNQTLETIK